MVGAQYVGKWNWGAWGLAPLWLMNHRKVGLGIAALFIALIPFVNIIFHIYIGFKGNTFAVDSGRFRNDMQFVAVQNAWRNWVFWIFGITIAVLVIAAFVGHH